jgi:hypothetical protein
MGGGLGDQLPTPQAAEYIYICVSVCLPQAHPGFFLGGGADPEDIYNLCLILNIML